MAPLPINLYFNTLDPAHGGQGGFGVRVFHDASVMQTALTITDNFVTKSDFGISFEDNFNFGNAVIRNNQLRDVHIGVLFLGQGHNNALSLSIADNTISPSATRSTGGGANEVGVFARFRSQYPEAAQIVNNDITLSLDNSIGVYALNEVPFSDAEDSDVNISNNTVGISQGRNTRGIRIQRGYEYQVFDNRIQQTVDDTGIGIQVTDSREVFLCGNTTLMSPSAWQGIVVSNSQQGSVVGSTTNNANFGIQMDGDCEPYNIAVNNIAGTPDIGIFHTMPGANLGFQTTDNQEGKQNTWQFGLIEVTTDGVERYFVDVNLLNSPVLDWNSPSLIGNIGCFTTTGEGMDGFTGYTGGPKKIAEMSPLPENGIYQLKVFNLYRRLQEAEEGYDPQFSAWLTDQAVKAPGLAYRIDSLLAVAKPTDAEKQTLATAHAQDDSNVVTTLNQTLAARHSLAKDNATAMLQNFSPNGSIEALWKAARLAQLSSEGASDAEVQTWYQYATTCYDATGPAGGIYAALYTAATGQAVDPSCGQEAQLRLPPSTIIPSELNKLTVVNTQNTLKVSGVDEGTELAVLDLNGRVLLSQKHSTGSRLYLPNLNPGMYLLTTREATPRTTKFIIQR